MSYADFLRSKDHIVEAKGFEPSAVNPMLYPFQAEIVRWALRRGQAAIFADCGMGKSFMQLEWARQFERTLIVAPIAVGQQTVDEGTRLGIPVRRVLETDPGPGITLTNYERLHRFDPGVYDAVVLDESSILKSMDGKTRGALIADWSAVPYRLCCTATPAPNDVSELANHAEFLGAMTRVEMLATFFVHDSDEGVWRLKGHATAEMWRWMSRWAKFVRRPSDLGYPDQGWSLPPLSITDEVVQTGLQMELGGIGTRPKVRKATLAARVQRAAQIIEASWTRKSDSGSDGGVLQTNPPLQQPPGSAGLLSQTSSGNGGSAAGTGSPMPNSTLLSKSRTLAVLSAVRPPGAAGVMDGPRASTLITTTAQAPSEGCSVPPATGGSDSSMMTLSSSTPQEATYSSEPWIVWCGLNAEEDALKASLGPRCVVINGKDSEDARIEKLARWRSGEAPVLISKAAVFGFGMNFQNCCRVMFLGLGDSYEVFYQAIRRCYRFGQTRPVDVRIVVSDIEGAISANVKRKEEEALKMAESIVAAAREGQTAEVREREDVYEPKTVDADAWTLMLGDCVERVKEIPDASVGLSVFSPPFASLYTYSSSRRDLGNCKDYDEFFKHFAFLIPELMRVTMPGRRAAVHVAQVGTTKATHGVIGWRDFRADVVKAFIAGGWVYDGEVCIDKDPQAQAIRTKSKQLMFVQKERDSAWLRPAMADYILLFRHPGENTEQIHNREVSNEEWILLARPIWYGIRESNVLRSYRDARTQEDEKHICPLQLETIERCIRLWTNPGDLVLSPFAGIGSEGYVSRRFGRRFIGIELKESYWSAAVENLKLADSEGIAQPTVFVGTPAPKPKEEAA